MSELRYQVDEARLAAFESNGVVRLPAVIDQELVERAREASEWATAETAKQGWPAEQEYFYRFRLWEKNAVFNTLCITSVVPEIAAQLLRTHKVNLVLRPAVRHAARRRPYALAQRLTLLASPRASSHDSVARL